jgi:hypothetical protein
LQCLYFRYVGVFLPHLIIFSQRLKLRLRPRFRNCDCARDLDILSATAIKRLRLHMRLPLHIFAKILSNVTDIKTAIATAISTVLRPQFSHCVCDRDSAIAIAALHCNRDFINCDRHRAAISTALATAIATTIVNANLTAISARLRPRLCTNQLACQNSHRAVMK